MAAPPEPPRPAAAESLASGHPSLPLSHGFVRLISKDLDPDLQLRGVDGAGGVVQEEVARHVHRAARLPPAAGSRPAAPTAGRPCPGAGTSAYGNEIER